jgi:hypothetical protein
MYSGGNSRRRGNVTACNLAKALQGRGPEAEEIEYKRDHQSCRAIYVAHTDPANDVVHLNRLPCLVTQAPGNPSRIKMLASRNSAESESAGDPSVYTTTA